MRVPSKRAYLYRPLSCDKTVGNAKALRTRDQFHSDVLSPMLRLARAALQGLLPPDNHFLKSGIFGGVDRVPHPYPLISAIGSEIPTPLFPSAFRPSCRSPARPWLCACWWRSRRVAPTRSSSDSCRRYGSASPTHSDRHRAAASGCPFGSHPPWFASLTVWSLPKSTIVSASSKNGVYRER